jgi:hypothetical protein
MLNQQMLDYIKQQMQQGVSQEQIKNASWPMAGKSKRLKKLLTTLL